MDEGLELTDPPLATSSQRSGAASAAAIFSVMCPIGIGGVLGMVLGFVALRQIAKGEAGRENAGMAWLGVIAGAVQLFAIGAGWVHLQGTLDETQKPVATFLSALAERDTAGVAESCANGLKPLLERGNAGEMVDRLDESVGRFKSTGERDDGWTVSLRSAQLVYTVKYPLHFESGAPVTGTFALVKEGGALRLLGFRLESPVLRPRIELGAASSAEIAEFEGSKKKEKPGLPEFKR